MSWIVRDLWTTLESRKNEYALLLDQNQIRAFEIINRIAYEVGRAYKVLLQLNFPPGAPSPTLTGLGHRNLSILVHRGLEQFDHDSETKIKEAFEPLKPIRFELASHGQEGFKAQLPAGRIDCLPSGIHLWCEITHEVLGMLDWVFTNVYGLEPV